MMADIEARQLRKPPQPSSPSVAAAVAATSAAVAAPSPSPPTRQSAASPTKRGAGGALSNVSPLSKPAPRGTFESVGEWRARISAHARAQAAIKEIAATGVSQLEDDCNNDSEAEDTATEGAAATAQQTAAAVGARHASYLEARGVELPAGASGWAFAATDVAESVAVRHLQERLAVGQAEKEAVEAKVRRLEQLLSDALWKLEHLQASHGRVDARREAAGGSETINSYSFSDDPVMLHAIFGHAPAAGSALTADYAGSSEHKQPPSHHSVEHSWRQQQHRPDAVAVETDSAEGTMAPPPRVPWSVDEAASRNEWAATKASRVLAELLQEASALRDHGADVLPAKHAAHLHAAAEEAMRAILAWRAVATAAREAVHPTLMVGHRVDPC